jgi:four helix bundle protein
MAEEGAQTFRELVAWQLCEELKEKVVEIVQRPTVSRDFKWCDQIRQSARSAPALIAEGYGRFEPAENAKYVRWAKGELNETRNWLGDGCQVGHISAEEYRDLYALTRRALTVCGRYYSYLRSERAKQNARRAANQPRIERRRTDRPEPNAQNPPPRTRTRRPEPDVQNPASRTPRPEPAVRREAADRRRR